MTPATGTRNAGAKGIPQPRPRVTPRFLKSHCIPSYSSVYNDREINHCYNPQIPVQPTPVCATAPFLTFAQLFLMYGKNQRRQTWMSVACPVTGGRIGQVARPVRKTGNSIHLRTGCKGHSRVAHAGCGEDGLRNMPPQCLKCRWIIRLTSVIMYLRIPRKL